MPIDADDESAAAEEEPPSPRRRKRFGRKSRRAHFSEILREIAGDETRERVSVGDLLAAMGDRAFGAMMLVFALPNAVPTPPGTSAVLGAPLVFLATQLTLGQKPWLPKVVARRSMLRSDFAALVERLGPLLARAEKLLRPRLSALTVPPAENVLGFLCLILALILVLPIPLGNMLPAFAICLFAFAILERDGLWMIAGVAAFALSVFIVSGVVYALVKATIFIFSNSLD